MTGVRHKARIAALQALYQFDYIPKPEEVLAHLASNKALPQETLNFGKELVQGVLQNKAQIDELINLYAPTFPVAQMSVIDRNILRLAIFEILFDNATPTKVAINEAVELAKDFGSDASSRLINGVLGSIVKERQNFIPSQD